MVELVIVIILIGILAAIGVPRLMGQNDTPALVFGEQLASTLREANRSALAKRRLVCLSSSATTLRLRIRTNPARATDAEGLDACNAVLAGLADGDDDSPHPDVTQAGLPAALYFHPDGTVSATPAGAPLGQFQVAIRLGGKTERTIVVDGRTGHVD